MGDSEEEPRKTPVLNANKESTLGITCSRNICDLRYRKRELEVLKRSDGVCTLPILRCLGRMSKFIREGHLWILRYIENLDFWMFGKGNLYLVFRALPFAADYAPNICPHLLSIVDTNRGGQSVASLLPFLGRACAYAVRGKSKTRRYQEDAPYRVQSPTGFTRRMAHRDQKRIEGTDPKYAPLPLVETDTTNTKETIARHQSVDEWTVPKRLYLKAWGEEGDVIRMLVKSSGITEDCQVLYSETKPPCREATKFAREEVDRISTVADNKKDDLVGGVTCAYIISLVI